MPMRKHAEVVIFDEARAVPEEAWLDAPKPAPGYLAAVWTPEQEAELTRLYLSGEPLRVIAKKVDKTIVAIQSKVVRLGLHRDRTTKRY